MTVASPSLSEFTGWLFSVLELDENTEGGDYTSVAEKLEDLRMWSEAAAAWTRAQRPLQAARAYIRCPNLEGARSVLEKARRDESQETTYDREEGAFWAESSRILESSGYDDLAATARKEAAANFRRAGESHRRAGRWEAAAEMFEEAGDMRSAVNAWRRAKPSWTTRKRLLAAMERFRKESSKR